MDNAVKNIVEALQQGPKVQPYDTQAEVRRVEGSTAYVHIPGGVDETPVALTIDAKPGDTVQVRIAGGKAWITGNASAPPTDDTLALSLQGDIKVLSGKYTTLEIEDAALMAKITRGDRTTMVRAYEDGVEVGRLGNQYRALIDATNSLFSIVKPADPTKPLDHTTYTTIASFGEEATIGDPSKGHVTITDHLFEMSDKDGTSQIAVIGDMRDGSGQSEITESFVSTSAQMYYALACTPVSGTTPTVTVDGTATTAFSLVVIDGVTNVRFVPTLGYRQNVSVTYVTTDEAPYYIFGSAKAGYNHAPYSVISGYDCVSSGVYSHSEGLGSLARNVAAHAEGEYSEAFGRASHSEGIGTGSTGRAAHASGEMTQASGAASYSTGYMTMATGDYSFAGGEEAIAEGDGSTALGLGTHAVGKYQTVIGKYNVDDNGSGHSATYADGAYALIIGNGTGDSARSNALTVEWDGTLTAAGLDLTTLDSVVPSFVSSMTNWGSIVQKVGRICILRYNATSSVARAANTTLATLPAGYRPVTTTSINARTNNNAVGLLAVYADGRIQCASAMTSGDGHRAIICYMVE